MDNKEKIRLAINQISINNCDGSANEDAIKAVRYLQEVTVGKSKGIADAEQCDINVVSNSFNLEIKDRDIATIEAMHDTLLDNKILGLNAKSMKESRALTQRMYKALRKD